MKLSRRETQSWTDPVIRVNTVLPFTVELIWRYHVERANGR